MKPTVHLLERKAQEQQRESDSVAFARSISQVDPTAQPLGLPRYGNRRGLKPASEIGEAERKFLDLQELNAHRVGKRS